ncbi:MAG: PilZ domain-containing protein [Desulfobacteraceae bacterium]|nr:MAG: PilZ domain-containing protein [Desulfobacteraceae bacterium]
MNHEKGEKLFEPNTSDPPRFFQNEALIKTFDEAKTMDQRELINTVNYIHFTDSPVFVLLQHPAYQDKLLAKAYPEPCFDNKLTCQWDESYFQYKLESYHPLYIVLINNQSMIVAPINMLTNFKNSFTIQLPEKSFVLNQRKAQRYPCRGIFAELIQSDFVARGELIDFSSEAFRIKANSEAFKHNNCFNPAVPASVRLISNDKIIYTELCKCIRRQDDHNISKEIVFGAENNHISRFLAKKIRNPRRQISPPLAAVFEHPFLKKKIHRDIFDISTTGFSIRDRPDDDLLMPGMMIQDLSIIHAGLSIASCAAQIIYRRKVENNVRYGIAILDMDIHSYSRINHILSINSDPRISVSSEVDTDALWEFFFQTGFIYPEKYRFCMAHRENFIKTYRKLYQENPEIARHITYEKNGRIYGHMSMIRAYERTWLIHHHAARSMGNNKLPGFVVLRQMMIFLNGMYQLYSSNMDYVICYFRPENKFPDRAFGGFARDINNPQACSLDLFSYLSLPVTFPEKCLPQGWLLRESISVDLWELAQFYKHNSGGLLLNILRFGESEPDNNSLEKVSERLGFLRRWRIYSLIHQDHLKAVFIVDQSDLAINMSNLLNCIKVLITDPSGLPSELLSLAVSKLGSVYNLDKVTLLIYPAAYVKLDDISYKKQYQLWILNLRYSNQFMDYIQKHFRMQYV